MRVIFMGTPDFALPTLHALIRSEHEVCAVYTAPPKPAKRGKRMQCSSAHSVADRLDIPVETPVSLKTEEAQQQFAQYQADVAIVIAYGLLLPKAILEMPRYGCINVHPSALPRWRGAAPLQRTLMAGDTTTSLCIMKMDEGLDSGPVFIEEPYDIPPHTSVGMLHDVMAEKAAPLILETLKGLEDHTLLPIPQSESGIMYAPKIDKAECLIDFTQPAETIIAQIYGLSPAPGAYILYEGERIKWLEAGIVSHETLHPPGTVIDDMCGVQTATGIIRPLVMQRAGKKPMSTHDCLCGYAIKEGTVL